MSKMFEQLNKQIHETQELIREKTTLLSSLKEELAELEVKSWSPPDGIFVVYIDGTVLELSNFQKETHGVDPKFGNIRSSKKKAKQLAKSQKDFNRISAYFDDQVPVIKIEHDSDFSTVSMIWYDYSKSNLSTFKREVIC